MIVVYILFTCSILLIIVSIWALICNKTTYEQRLQLISNWRVSSDFDKAHSEFEAVTYEKHLHTLMLFRDPIKLYGPITQLAWSRQ